MEIINKLRDERINAYNVLFEISIEDYHKLAMNIIEKNHFQRRRVKSSSTVYTLLKKDLEIGCIMPPMVLALSKDNVEYNEQHINDTVESNLNSLIILDGLQRTYTINDLIKELEDKGDESTLEKVLSKKIRIEIYIGINKLGILYRMLTLNTGQTPMSMRHQIEILYSDFLDKDLENNIKLITELDNETPTNLGEYKFKDIIEGFNSYLERDYLPLTRSDILDNITSLEKLSSENQESDLFLNYINLYHNLVKKFIELSNHWEYDEENLEKKLISQPFAKDMLKIITKSQVMTGFGSALGKLIDLDLLENLTDVAGLIEEIIMEDENKTIELLLHKLDEIKRDAKKIGNDQRMFFHFFFRELFDKKGDAYLNINMAINEAYSSYIRKTS